MQIDKLNRLISTLERTEQYAESSAVLGNIRLIKDELETELNDMVEENNDEFPQDIVEQQQERADETRDGLREDGRSV